MQLEPGDRRIVAVRPYVEVGLAPDACDRCGQELLGPRTWELVVREGSDPVETTMVVCSTCAGSLRPVRVTVDRAAVERAGPEHGALQRLLVTIDEARSDPPADTIRLRASDVTRLADADGLSRAAFVQRLADAGIVTDLS